MGDLTRVFRAVVHGAGVVPGQAEVDLLAEGALELGEKTNAAAWAYCQTCWHVPGQQSTPSQPHHRPLSKPCRVWVARQSTVTNERSSSQ